MRLHRIPATAAADVAHRAAVAFGGRVEEADVERWRASCDRGEVWGVGDPVVAQCRVSSQPHWFGGLAVPAQQIAAVAVPPEHRGKGAARALLQGLLERGYRHGAGLSVLFPATTAVYRKLGYEHAGWYSRFRLRARPVPPIGPALRPATSEDWEGIRACQSLMSARLQGPWRRPDDRWARAKLAPYHYVLDGPGGEITAYVLVDHAREQGEWQYSLAITDWAATTSEGLAAVVGFIGRHGTLAKSATFAGPQPDLFALLTDEQDAEITSTFYWMARALSLPAALEARGYPQAVSLDVVIQVSDRGLPEAGGAWRIRIANGKAATEPAGDAEVRMDARAVGPLFTGFRTPAALQLAGLVDGSPDVLESLGAAFAGSPPTLLDFF